MRRMVLSRGSRVNNKYKTDSDRHYKNKWELFYLFIYWYTNKKSDTL